MRSSGGVSHSQEQARVDVREKAAESGECIKGKMEVRIPRGKENREKAGESSEPI